MLMMRYLETEAALVDNSWNPTSSTHIQKKDFNYYTSVPPADTPRKIRSTPTTIRKSFPKSWKRPIEDNFCPKFFFDFSLFSGTL